MYTTHIKDIFTFICKEEGIKIPFPIVVFHKGLQKCSDSVFSKTGYFDPNTNKIHLFLCDNERQRAVKDVLRSFAHESIHYIQQYRGDIKKSNYVGDKITEDKNLIKLEKEAYLKGNVYFRKYTELLQANHLNRRCSSK